MKIHNRKTGDCLLIAAVALLGTLTASADTVYVAYVDTNTIEKFDLATGADLGVFASAGLSEPYGLALDSAGDLYVANAANNTIEKFTPGGLGSVFANAGLDIPVGLAADSVGNIYAGNTNSDQFAPGYVQKFTPGGVGSFFASTGDDPSGLAFDSAGNLYVANANDNTIYKITSGGGVSFFASTASYPSGLAVDNAGNLYVTIYFSNTIEKFSSAGTDLGAFASTGLSGPAGLAFDSAGNLYVANTTNNTIEKFTTGGVGSLFANTGGVPTFIAIQHTPIAAQIQPPINADDSSVFKASRGVVPVKFTLAIGGVATCNLSPATISVTRTAGGTIGAIDESIYESSADSGPNFRVSDCQYVYNLAAS
jgi:sugar lactone lactonase YvrE